MVIGVSSGACSVGQWLCPSYIGICGPVVGTPLHQCVPRTQLLCVAHVGTVYLERTPLIFYCPSMGYVHHTPQAQFELSAYSVVPPSLGEPLYLGKYVI